MKRKHLSARELLRKGVPMVLIPGLLAAAALGWNAKPLIQAKNWYASKTLFPYEGTVTAIEDGDTFMLASGRRVRLLGINASDRGREGYDEAVLILTDLALRKRVFLEYDRYQDDKFGRILAWVWVGCEDKPRFAPSEYMHKSGNASMPGLIDNPEGCRKGKLVNEQLVRSGAATPVVYTDRGEMKYEARLGKLAPK